MVRTQNRTMMIVLAILFVVTALPALAQGRHGFSLGGGGRAHAQHARGILGQLIFPCPAACADTARTCLDDADGAALTCVTGACSAEITTAQTACAEDRTSEDCEDAVEALSDCADTCLDTRADAVDVCRDTARDCRDACESDE